MRLYEIHVYLGPCRFFPCRMNNDLNRIRSRQVVSTRFETDGDWSNLAR